MNPSHSPISISISIFHIIISAGTMRITEPFVVMGFSVSGKVVDQQGKGVADTLIKVDGKEKTKTDANG